MRDRPLASRCPASRSVTTCLCTARTVMGRVVAEAGSGRQLDGVQGAVVDSEHPVGPLQEGGSVRDNDPGETLPVSTPVAAVVVVFTASAAMAGAEGFTLVRGLMEPSRSPENRKCWIFVVSIPVICE